MKQDYSVYIIIAAIILIAAFVGWSVWESHISSLTATSTAVSMENTASSSTSAVGQSISVDSQPAGAGVIVKSVNVTAVSWAVVTEDLNGHPARILGAVKVNPGERSTVVSLLRNTMRGSTYHAIIYVDDGDGEFDYKVDAPLQGASGNAVESVFKAS